MTHRGQPSTPKRKRNKTFDGWSSMEKNNKIIFFIYIIYIKRMQRAREKMKNKIYYTFLTLFILILIYLITGIHQYILLLYCCTVIHY